MLTLTERRRLVLVAVITLIAVPIFLFTGKDSSPTNSTSTVMTNEIADSKNSEPADPAFLPVADKSPAPEIITVNVPVPLTGTHITGTASFIRWIETLGLRPCATPHALIGAIITVSNLNNGRSTTCNNVSIQALTGGNIIIIHTEVFLELADLVDAPLPIEISF